MKNNLSKKQVEMVTTQLTEIKRLIDLSNHRTGKNRCGASEASKKELDTYLNTWVGIALSKIEGALGLDTDTLWSEEEMKRP